MRRQINFLFFLILILSSSLRIALALVNREANDDHLTVTRQIMLENRLPEFQDCAACSHPKLFYYTTAVALQAAKIGVKDIASQYVFTQIENSLLGIAVLLIVWAFLNSLPGVDDSLKIIAFALTAFNPKLIGINAQATNDTLAIFISTLALYFAYRFIKEEKTPALFACIVFASLGLATKETTLPITGSIFVALLVKAYRKGQRTDFIATTVFLVGVMALALLDPLTQYVSNYQKHGNIVVMNTALPSLPLPAFIEKSYYLRPGLVSIQDGLFTFKYINLLEYPRLTNAATDYPAHRTSLWTQIYARAHSVHFDNWPVSWGSTGDEYFTLTRAIYILALFPTALLALGAVMNLAKFLAAILSSKFSSTLAEMDYGLLTVAFWSSIAFVSLFAVLYRDFSTMKAIFIYPALLAYPALFIQSAALFKENKWFRVSLSVISFLLVALYIADITTLTVHLYSQLQ